MNWNTKAPSSNIQALHPPQSCYGGRAEKLQSSSSKAQPRTICLEVEVWNFSGVWSLDVGASVIALKHLASKMK
jgi:hypothetical protein